MHIGLYLGSWNLATLGGMGTYLTNLFQAIERGPTRPGEPSITPQITILTDRNNRGAASSLGLNADVVSLDRPAWNQIPANERRRVLAVRKLSYRDPDAADARRSERWSDAAAQYLWGLDEAVRAAEIDLLYFPIPPYLKRPRVPVLLTIHDLKHLHRPQDHAAADMARRRRWRHIVGAANLVYSSYEHIRRDVMNAFGVAPRRAAMLPLAAPAACRAKRSASSPMDHTTDVARFIAQPFALMPAQFWVHKNHSLVFLALAKLRKNHDLAIPLVCTGQTDGECAAHAARMKQLAEKLGIADQVCMAGFVNAAQLRDLYERARLVLVATLYDPGSFPALEALALGKPLIASNVTSIPEAVGDAGVLFDPTSVDSLCDALRKLWPDDALRNTLAARGPARIPKRTWDDVARDWLELCQRAMQNHEDRHLTLVNA